MGPTGGADDDGTDGYGVARTAQAVLTLVVTGRVRGRARCG